MSRFSFEEFEDDDGIDLEGVGITIDDLDLDALDLSPDIRTLIEQRHNWNRPPRWWSTSPQEAHHHSTPEFTSMEDRARYMISAMARPVLDKLGASDDAMVLVDRDGEMVSLNDLLARFDYAAAVMAASQTR